MFSLHAAWPCKPCVALADFFHVRSSWKQAIVGRSAQEGCPKCARNMREYIAKTAVSPFQSRVGCMTVELHISPSWVMNYQKMQVQENRNSSPIVPLGQQFLLCCNMLKPTQVACSEVFPEVRTGPSSGQVTWKQALLHATFTSSVWPHP